MRILKKSLPRFRIVSLTTAAIPMNGCAVRKATVNGDIHPNRYDSYLRLRFGGGAIEDEDE